MDKFLSSVLGPSWRTSLSGVGAVLAVAADIAFAYAHGKSPNWEADIGILLAGFGLVQAKDRNVSNAGIPVEARRIEPQKEGQPDA
jgi:hypothetical protein